MNRKIIVAVLCLVFLGSSLIGPGQSAVSPDSDATVTSCIQHERQDAYRVPDDTDPIVTIHRTSNDSVIRYVFNGTGGDGTFGLTLPEGTRVTNTSGFSVEGDSAEREYNSQNPWIEIVLGSPQKGVEYSTTEQTVVVPLPQSDDVDLFFKPDTVGYVGAHFALLGEYNVGTAHTGCQRIHVVVPSNTNLKRADHYAQAIADAGSRLDIGHRYRLVTAFVAPVDTGNRNGFNPRRFDEKREPSAEFYISPQSQLTNPKNTWIHEYIHTRQATSHPEWVVEGSATYFAAQLSVGQGWISPRQYDRFFAKRAIPNGSPQPLQEGMAPYIHGAFFFSQLDEDLRDSDVSAEDIYRQLNQQAMSGRGSGNFGASEIEAVVESKIHESVNYSNPMSDPVPIVYLGWPERSWSPLRACVPTISEKIAIIFGGYVVLILKSTTQD